jgi:hypothetical protein
MSSNETADFHEHHLQAVIETILRNGDLCHEIVFVKSGQRQMLVLVPFGPTRAILAAVQAISEADRPDILSVASLVWTKRYDSLQSYRLGDVARASDKRELLVVSTADNTGRRYSSFREVIRDGGDVKLKEVEDSIPLDDLAAALTGGDAEP